jgi:multidrug transporter EmrE-like cation transporter
VVGYVAAFVLLTLTLKQDGIGIAYGIWRAVSSPTAVAGSLLSASPLTEVMMHGIASHHGGVRQSRGPHWPPAPSVAPA